MERHVRNAERARRFLDQHPAGQLGQLPGLAGEPVSRAATEIPAEGTPARSSAFGVKGGRAAGQVFIESLETDLAPRQCRRRQIPRIHPASTTHQQLSDEQRSRAGVSPDLIRFSVGLEDRGDIMWDLDQALVKANAAVLTGAAIMTAIDRSGRLPARSDCGY